MCSLFWAFFRIGAFGFGGGYVMIPLIQREIVEVRGWLSTAEFTDVIAIAEMTPGPIAINAATFVGFRQMGLAGALAATAGVVVPPVMVMLCLSYLFMRYSSIPVLQSAFSAVRPVAVALIAAAALTVGGSVVKSTEEVVIMLAALAALSRTRLHPVIILGFAGLLGVALYSL